MLDVKELAAAAAWALKSGGKFFCVYLPSRMAELLYALKSRALEPKRMQFISPSPSEPPSLLLLEAKKDAAPGMTILPPLHLYTDTAHREEGEEIKDLYRLFGE